MYQRTKRIFFRNSLIFALALVVCTGFLTLFMLKNHGLNKNAQYDIEYTARTLEKTGRFSENLQDMISNAINYSMIKEEKYLEQFLSKSQTIQTNMESLFLLVEGDKVQEDRTKDLQQNFTRFKEQLETQSQDAQTQNYVDTKISDYAERLRARMLAIHGDILRDENEKLRNEILKSRNEKDTYFRLLIFGIFAGAILLFILNSFLYRAQSGRLNVEEKLQINEERFKLAIEGTNDGIFDWDLRTNKVFYSAQFFQMLGYETEDMNGTLENFNTLLHPEDFDRMWDYTNRYLAGEIPEYISSFRMKHKNGNWVWIQSRAKALYDYYGAPIRMVGAHSDITYLKEYQEFLKREKQHAEKANIAKSEFLAHMSHEIRTPLTAINGIAEIFEKNIDQFNEKQQRLVKTLKNSTSSLKDLINDILDFSKIEEGQIRLEYEEVILSPFFDQIYQLTSIQASEKNIDYFMDYQELEHEKIHADPIRLRQIMINLIGNALKFTKEGSVSVEVTKETYNQENMLKIEVRDTGIGIPADRLDVIFERFKQSDDSISRSYGGTGLGLSISKKLVDMMGGIIRVESTEGEGSVFWVMVPIERAEAGSSLNIKNIEEAPKEKPKKAKSRKAVNDDKGVNKKLSGKRVLIVEDYEGNVVILGYILDQMELEFDVAVNGVEALEKCKTTDYDLILMDIQMPMMDGYTATRQIRMQEDGKTDKAIPIIGMTAHALIGDKEKCLAAGMNAYVPKPINENDLREEIVRLIS